MRIKEKITALKEYIYDSATNIKDRSFVIFSIMLISELLFVAVPLGLLMHEPLSSTLSTFAGAMVFALYVLYSVKRGKIENAKIVISVILIFAFLPLMFFTNGGVYGGVPVSMLLGGIYINMVLEGKTQIVMNVAFSVTMIVCWIVGYNRSDLVTEFTKEGVYIDSLSGLLIVHIVIYVLLAFHTKLYEKENETAREKSAELEEVNRSQNRFFSSMSHEIRTPINSILGLNELILRQEDTSDEVARDAQNIQGAGKMLLALINDILDFSKIEAGSMDIVPVEYRVSDMISEIVNMIWLRASEKGLKFDVDIDPHVPAVLFGDEVRIKQILVNLLNNAVKYTQEGTVGLHIESEEAGDDRVLLKISVADTGMGIKQEAIPYLFDAFKRVDQEKNRCIEGTGLGLSIVKQLVGLMNGTITVNSVYTQGSTFTVNLEQGVVDEKGVGDISITGGDNALARQKHERRFSAPEAKILIVDDNEMNLEVEKKLLGDTEMMIDTAQSGALALEKTLQTKYDVILMDHLMPEMDGIECLKKIRSQTGGLNNNATVIVLTANAGGENRELYNNEGFDGYLVKPVSGRQLEDMLLKHLPKEKVLRTESSDMTGEEMNTAKGYSRKLPVLIATSSISDLPDAVVRQLGIGIVPSTIRTADGVFRDGVDIGADELIRYISAGNSKANSAPPGVKALTEFFGAALKKAHHVIYITMTTSMSEEYKRATLAAGSFENVSIVNSECLSSATGLLVLIACRLAKQNRSAEEIVEELERAKKRIHCSFIINTTDYMARAGRVSKTVNGIAKALELRPCLKLKNDKSGFGGIWMGKTRHCYDRYIQSTLRASAAPDTDVLFVTYADISEEDLNWIAGRVYGRVAFERIVFQRASAAVSANCGPGTFGLLFLEKGEQSYNLDALIPEERSLPDVKPAHTKSPAGAETATAQKAAEADAPPAPAAKAYDLPDWLREVEEINVDVGMKYCGVENVYLDTLKIYGTNAPASADEIETLWRSDDLANTTIKVHAIKSLSRTIGAEGIGALAEKLEHAGKAGDADAVGAEIDALLARIRKTCADLAPLCGSGEAAEDESLPMISDDELQEAYEELCGFAAGMDAQSAAYVFDFLAGYRLPPGERERVAKVKRAIENFEWEQVGELLK